LREYRYRFIVIPRRFVRMRTRTVDLGQLGDTTGHDVVAVPDGDAFTTMCVALKADRN
jgi:hypothetical protein